MKAFLRILAPARHQENSKPTTIIYLVKPDTNSLQAHRIIPKPQTEKGYKGSNDENWAEYVFLESKQRQTHVRKYEVLSQEVQYLK